MYVLDVRVGETALCIPLEFVRKVDLYEPARRLSGACFLSSLVNCGDESGPNHVVTVESPSGSIPVVVDRAKAVEWFDAEEEMPEAMKGLYFGLSSSIVTRTLLEVPLLDVEKLWFLNKGTQSLQGMEVLRG